MEQPGDKQIRIWDLKSVGSAHPDAVDRMARRMDWLGQLAHYRAGMMVRNPTCAVGVGLICVETAPPYGVGVYEIDPVDLAEADERRRAYLAIVRECEESGTWPGYTDRSPAWLAVGGGGVEITGLDEEDEDGRE